MTLHGHNTTLIELNDLNLPDLEDDNLTIAANYLGWYKVILILRFLGSKEIEDTDISHIKPILDRMKISNQGMTHLTGPSHKWLSLLLELDRIMVEIETDPDFIGNLNSKQDQ